MVFITFEADAKVIYIQKGMTAFSDFFVCVIVTSGSVVWLKQYEEIA